MRRVTLIGMGCGAGTLTADARSALFEAAYIVGSKRLLAALPQGCTRERGAATKPDVVAALLKEKDCENACVVFSGDSGFYSGARGLLPLLNEYEVKVLPGVSSVQTLAAALGRPWQGWRLVTAHGVLCDPVYEATRGAPVLFLTGGVLSPDALCRALTEAGLGALGAVVGENLSCPEERIVRGTAAAFAAQKFASLSVLLIEAAPVTPRRTPGWPDGEFLRAEKIPMTKQAVRAAALAKLAVTPADVCWDIGAGTGSVSVELAAVCRSVWAVEQKPEAAALAGENRKKFHAYNLHILEGRAPDALTELPAPDAVFVGGSGGELPEILKAVQSANAAARVCVCAIALETLHTAAGVLKELGYDVEVAQIAASRARAVGALHLLTAQNPVFLITGTKP